MELIRPGHLAELVEAYHEGTGDKKLRSYYLPDYQQRMIDVLADGAGISKAEVVRRILDEWYAIKVGERAK